MDSYNVNPEHLSYESSYPSPSGVDSVTRQSSSKRKSPETDNTLQPEQPSKKKRKAWGQPVPPINPILPPRKRAKTEEEKEQRKNERILRNRRAADKSRQRQKAAVADLEIRTTAMEQENANLKAMLQQYRSKFGDLDGFSFNLSSLSTYIKQESVDESMAASTPASDYSHTTESSIPAMTPRSPVILADRSLPPLTNNLFSEEAQINDMNINYMAMSGLDSNNVSGMTQYPAAILWPDLQCQPKTLEPIKTFNQFIRSLILINLWTISGTFLLTMHSPLYQLYQILVGTLPPSSTEATISQILTNHFPLITSLIFPSMTVATTNLRMKLLSRLLTCSPKMARLLLAATDRELRVVVDDACFGDDVELRSQWARLMTLKWMVVKLEVEHGRYRRLADDERMYQKQNKGDDGIDYVGLERSLRRWKESLGQSQLGSKMHNVQASELEVC